MASDSTELGQKLFKRCQNLWAKREAIFDPMVQEISDYFMPDMSDIQSDKTESVDWFDDIFDTTPIQAVETCSVGIRNWVTPSTEPWLQMSPPANLQRASKPMNARMGRITSPQNPEVDEDGQDDAQRWCSDEATGCMLDLQSCNFYTIIQSFNRAACTSGTALMFCEEGKSEAFLFEQFKFGTFAVAENDQKIVDTVFRKFKLTVRQAKQKFGEDELPKKMTEALKSKKYDTEFKFIHCVYPNEDYERGKVGKDGMAYASVYISEDEKKIVSHEGYEEMPYFCLRFSRWGTDNQVYGCSPAYIALANARQINTVTQFDDALVELKAYPRFFIPDSLTGEVELAAGAATVIKAEDMARGVVPKEWMTQGEHGSVLEMIQRKEAAINKAFFVDIFTALGQLGDKLASSTLGAIALLQGEKLDQFTGTFDQYRTELINPLVRRMMGIRIRSGRSGQPPQSLFVPVSKDPKEGMELAVPKIEIKSRVTLALNEIKNVGVQKTMETLAPIAEQRPEILDNFDLEQVARETGRNYGMPERMIRPMKQVKAMREARAKQMQENRAMAMAEQGASAAGKLGKAPQQMQEQVGQMMNFNQG